MKKILAFTSIRSDYDLMSPLYRLLHEDNEIDFKLIVSGAHLSKNFGYSVNQIKEDGFEILLEVETLLNSDSRISRVKSASILFQNIIDIVSKHSPDIMIYAGDREDVLIYAMIGGYLNIPTIHFFSGDHVEDGYIDNPVRHATSKLSTMHFVALDLHRKRLIRMGESPNRIFVTGNISLDKFVHFKAVPKVRLLKQFQLDNSWVDFALLIFHPITAELDVAAKYFENILNSLENKSINTFVSYPNIDLGNSALLKVIEKYSENENFYFYKNLGREEFLSMYKQSKFIIGNSSSGIYEAASFKLPAINVGLRQKGRYSDKNVLFCGGSKREIENAISKVLSNSFQEELLELENSYGSGNSAVKAYEFIKENNFTKLTQKVEDPLKVKLYE